MNPIVKTIKSENDVFQLLVSLKENRQKRSKHKQFFVEGVANINAVLKYNYDVVAFVYSSSRKQSKWLENILASSHAEVHYRLSDALLEKLSDRDNESELMAVVHEREYGFDDVSLRDNFLVVVLDRPTNPGNLGSTIRSCNLLNVDLVVILGHAADIHDSNAIRSSIGTVFAQAVVHAESFSEFSDWLGNVKRQYPETTVVGTSAKATSTITEIEYTRPTILLFGNETNGLSNNLKNICNNLVRIPTGGYASSLNLSCAISIFLYEAMRQRTN